VTAAEQAAALKAVEETDTAAPAVLVLAFGRRVRDLRREAGRTLGDLASDAGVGPSVLSRIENGSGTTIATAARLARSLGVPVAALLPSVDCGWCLDAPPAGYLCAECGLPGPRAGS
jgi:predicted transcriptional regulator